MQRRSAHLAIFLIRHDGSYLEGHGNLASRLLKGIIGAITWLVGVTNLLTKSRRPFRYCCVLSSGGKLL